MICWTEFPDKYATTKMSRSGTWHDFIERIRTAGTFKTKDLCPWIKGATFGEVRSEKDSLRHDANVLEIYAVEGDYDGEEISMEEAIEKLERFGVRAVVYPSPSHTEEKPRWRVIAPLSHPFAGSFRQRFLARINGVLGGVLANESFTLSQSYYFGATPTNHYRVLITFDDPEDGTCVDQLDEFDEFAIGKVEVVDSSGAKVKPSPDMFAVKVKELGRKLKTGDGRRDMLKSFIASRSAKRVPAADIRMMLEGIVATYFDETDGVDWNDIDKLIEHFREKDRNSASFANIDPETGEVLDEGWQYSQMPSCITEDAKALDDLLHTIEVAQKPLDLQDALVKKIAAATGVTPLMSETLAQAIKKKSKKIGSEMLIADARSICVTNEQREYAKAIRLHHIEKHVAGRIRIQPKGGDLNENAALAAKVLNQICFYRGGHVVHIVESHEHGMTITGTATYWIARELTGRVAFMTENDEPMDCPQRLAEVLVNGARDDFYLPLAGIARAPFMRDDGSLCVTPGYDVDSALWLDLRGEVKAIPECPSKQDAMTAKARLLTLVQDFPFANAASRSAWLADLLAAVARPNLSTMPITVYVAPMPGTGKTLLCETVNLIAYGDSSLANWPQGEAELSKQLTSALDAGDAYICFDNVQNGLGIHSAVLAQFVTTSTYQDRRLGFTERVRYKNRMRIAMSGNNISLTHDLARRGIVVELDLNAETPRGRTFVIGNLKEHVMAHRMDYIADALTILRAHHLANDKPQITPLESFEEWSRTVQSALIWLEESDPVETVAFEESGIGDLGYLFCRLSELMALHGQCDWWSTSKLVEFVRPNSELTALLDELGCNDPASAKSAGHWLKANKNRVAGGFKLLTKRDPRTKSNTWRFQRLDIS